MEVVFKDKAIEDINFWKRAAKKPSKIKFPN